MEPIKLRPLARDGVFLHRPAIELSRWVQMRPPAIEPFEVADRQDAIANHAPFTFGAAAGIEADRQFAGAGGVFVQHGLAAAPADTETGVVGHAAAGAYPLILSRLDRRGQPHFGITKVAVAAAHVVHFAVFVQVIEDGRGGLIVLGRKRFCPWTQHFPLGMQPALGDFAKLFADDLKPHTDGACDLQSHNRYCIPKLRIFSRLA